MTEVIEQPAAEQRTGERILGALLYALFGLIVGTVTTFLHRGRVELFETTLWVGIVLGLACILCLGIGLRLYLVDRWMSTGFAVGVIVAVVGLGVWNPGSSVVVVGDVVGLAWLALASLVAAGCAFWPALPSRRSRTATGGGEYDERSQPS
ncbi:MULTISPECIES: hypothetical protein [unclassified Pseudoclavibacter]|uniref:hypothetical protein n=1 Tax=unclassified Pseudoclavibacter TaxID=2615177 RepID=UPI000CE725FA|nr:MULTISPECIES: hypothetical protein [unclassified Pseudoclavibacter]MBF4549773.1 hypothetical protein [Pseudoclavibacter sp. VKM Ac-2888]PPF39731.1 hypothetical protein C5E05_00475 [Pseudoclavibacter sp. AY1H1]PPG03087.1 hypothetical protein C5E06_11755 [Pseudoclavibacter sp. RFBI5]